MAMSVSSACWIMASVSCAPATAVAVRIIATTSSRWILWSSEWSYMMNEPITRCSSEPYLRMPSKTSHSSSCVPHTHA